MSANSPFMKRLQNRSRGFHGHVTEKRKARVIGAKRVIASGAIPGMKGDLVKGNFLIESKATIHDSFAIKKEVLDKISLEALNASTMPALAFSFVQRDGASIAGGDWIILRQVDWVELVEWSSSKER